ncbi:SubName: Full=Uncharacterized protein {ECO:0000313/EMBL:CCA74517.1} [Serendipita indica DSM 11827]|nr:SubName: Full=Uncharacterized protein {ECO:0000313/EMBL:CCA74517.1} [Serendipita indica DSM 11827]
MSDLSSSTISRTPICRLPPEILQKIFLQASQLAFSSPWRLSAVCRLFRDIIFQTPSIWANLDIGPTRSAVFPHPELLRLWRSRLKDRKGNLSVSLAPWVKQETVDAVVAEAASIGFLSFFDRPMVLLASNFPHLVELRMGHFRSSWEAICRLNHDEVTELIDLHCSLPAPSQTGYLNLGERFPALKVLHIHQIPLPTLLFLANTPQFPPLQELCVHSKTNVWLLISTLCKDSLRKLTIRHNCAESSFHREISSSLRLAKLTSLTYICTLSPEFDPESLVFPNLITPQLDYYHQESPFHTEFAHRDLSTATHIVWAGKGSVQWRQIPSVIKIEILHRDIDMLRSSFLELAENPDQCRELRDVVLGVDGYLMEELRPLAERILEILKDRSIRLELRPGLVSKDAGCFTYKERSDLIHNCYEEDENTDTTHDVDCCFCYICRSRRALRGALERAKLLRAAIPHPTSEDDDISELLGLLDGKITMGY